MPRKVVKVYRNGRGHCHRSLIQGQPWRVGENERLTLNGCFRTAGRQGQLLSCRVEANDVLTSIGEKFSTKAGKVAVYTGNETCALASTT